MKIVGYESDQGIICVTKTELTHTGSLYCMCVLARGVGIVPESGISNEESGQTMKYSCKKYSYVNS